MSKKRGTMNAERGSENSSSFRVPSSSFPPIPPKKRFGQNFLIDGRVIERIVREVDPNTNETIIEIGPGRGALTSLLVNRAGRVISIEFDRDLIPLLQDAFGGYENFVLIEEDALAIDLCATIAPSRRARVVANLPYYISTAILQRLIEQRACLAEMVLMLQREVVGRITAPPASNERGFLSVLVEAYCEAEALFDVPPAAFRPQPKVWSTVVRLRFRPQMTVTVMDEALLWRIVSAGFAQRRKTIFNNLRSAPGELRPLIEKAGGVKLILEKSEIEAQRRAETLTLEEWTRLGEAISDFGLLNAE